MLIQPGHEVVYDVADADVIRSIAVAGTLTFARDRDTELNVGVVTIYGAGQAIVPDDDGVADAHAHHAKPASDGGGARDRHAGAADTGSVHGPRAPALRRRDGRGERSRRWSACPADGWTSTAPRCRGRG